MCLELLNVLVIVMNISTQFWWFFLVFSIVQLVQQYRSSFIPYTVKGIELLEKDVERCEFFHLVAPYLLSSWPEIRILRIDLKNRLDIAHVFRSIEKNRRSLEEIYINDESFGGATAAEKEEFHWRMKKLFGDSYHNITPAISFSRLSTHVGKSTHQSSLLVQNEFWSAIS